MSAEKNKFPRPIRSYVKREGKLTKGQHNAIDELWPQFGVDVGDQRLALTSLFGREAFTVLEIGFGNGLSLAEMAKQNPEQNFFGIEVHTPGVGSLLVQVKKHGLQNIRVSQNDAVEVFAKQITDACLDRIQIFFPDPWHKKRHHKRRLIQPDFVATLVTKLKPDGMLHIATDWENYAEHIFEVLSNNPDLLNQAEGYATKPEYRPTTKYEMRGERLGHGVWDLLFQRK